MTHICIDSGTRAAKELGYQPILIGDATATRDLNHNGKTVKPKMYKLLFSYSWYICKRTKYC